jgi:proteasome assembly chaperone (PAC2) family protein
MEIREKITSAMQPADAAQIAQIKKKFGAAMAGKPFYPDLVEEVIREDYSKDGEKFREQILKKLAVPDTKPQITKPQISFKAILIEGLFAIGGTGSILAEIVPKMEENAGVLENRQKSFWRKIKKLMQQILNKEPEPVIYEVEYLDTVRGVKVKEKVNLDNFKNDMEHKIRTLQNISSRGVSLSKLESMDETQLLGILERNIRDVQSLHKILSALDDFFKAAVDQEDRDKIKGTKPELGSMKNAIIKANQKRYEYSAQKEEEEQFKRLGINSET